MVDDDCILAAIRLHLWEEHGVDDALLNNAVTLAVADAVLTVKPLAMIGERQFLLAEPGREARAVDFVLRLL